MSDSGSLSYRVRLALFTIAGCAIVFLPVGGALGYYCITVDPVIIPGKPITEIKYVPITAEEYRECYNSVIQLTGLWSDPFFKVMAQDKCKRTTQQFKIALPNTRKNMLAIYPVIGFDFRDLHLSYGGGFSYDREIISLLYVGAGLTVTNHDVQVYPRLAFHF